MASSWVCHPLYSRFHPFLLWKRAKGFFLKKVLLEKGTEISSFGKRELKKLFICG